MISCPICSRFSQMKQGATQMAGSTCQQAGKYAAIVYAAVCAWFSGLVISEATLIKTFFVSLGVLIGAHFSEFFKKHRWLVVFVLACTFVVFLYKALTDMEEEDEF